PKEASAPRRDKKRRLAVIREHESRTGSNNTGGVSRKKILTAYKEQALLTARILRDNEGPMLAREVKKAGGPPNTTSILSRNVLGWFSREGIQDGREYLYRVTDAGLAALEEYRELL
ncbi:MAG: hypothetical protein K2F83_04215, partial [Oscillospiraceae bacterium]|nr:hypothetical protein [Oscillospiraceae bacterium]